MPNQVQASLTINGLPPRVHAILQRLSEGFIDKTQLVSVTSHATPDTEFSVEHSLQTIPTGYLVISRDKAGVVYDSGTAWTGEFIYLKCNVASVALKLLIF